MLNSYQWRNNETSFETQLLEIKPSSFVDIRRRRQKIGKSGLLRIGYLRVVIWKNKDMRIEEKCAYRNPVKTNSNLYRMLRKKEIIGEVELENQ